MSYFGLMVSATNIKSQVCNSKKKIKHSCDELCVSSQDLVLRLKQRLPAWAISVDRALATRHHSQKKKGKEKEEEKKSDRVTHCDYFYLYNCVSLYIILGVLVAEESSKKQQRAAQVLSQI